MKKQLSLIDEIDLQVPIQSASDVRGRKITYEPIHVSGSTFLAGLSSEIHRWFRLTPSFGPDLVHEMLRVLRAKKTDLILDPFSGAGTTGIESALEGYNSVGFEINPFLQFVGTISTNWGVDPEAVVGRLRQISEEYPLLRERVSFETLEAEGYKIPPIHNPTRWWRPDVLTDLVVLLRCIDEEKSEPDVRNFLRLALAGVLIPDLTNVTLGRLQLHFINRDTAKIDVFGSFEKHLAKMLDDLRAVRKAMTGGSAKILLQDSTKLGGLKLHQAANCVITSPPYPNRYSYIWNTRPYLYLFGFLTEASEASDIDKRTIGGTWGTATSELMKGEIAPINDAVAQAVALIVAAIRKSDNLMANYAMHYFNRLAKQILELESVVADDARIAYVVGNSWLKGCYVATDEILASIVDNLGIGYRVSHIHRFRKRHSGKDLYESIVYAFK